MDEICDIYGDLYQNKLRPRTRSSEPKAFVALVQETEATLCPGYCWSCFAKMSCINV